MKIKKLKPYQDLSLQDIEGEEWRDIEGFEGYYMVSNMGRVKSLERKIWMEARGCYKKKICKILKQVPICRNNSTYLIVGFVVKSLNLKKRILVCRLVFQYFFNPPEVIDLRKRLISHIDKDGKNNHISNLRCVDESCIADYIGRGTKSIANAEGLKEGVHKFYFMNIKIGEKSIREYFKTEAEAAHKYDYYIKKYKLKRKDNVI